LSVVAGYAVDLALPASVELAKLLEHRTRDPNRALAYARQARDLHRKSGVSRVGITAPELERRIARLERKVDRGNGGTNATRSSTNRV
jgi:hypothetical protein